MNYKGIFPNFSKFLEFLIDIKLGQILSKFFKFGIFRLILIFCGIFWEVLQKCQKFCALYALILDIKFNFFPKFANKFPKLWHIPFIHLFT